MAAQLVIAVVILVIVAVTVVIVVVTVVIVVVTVVIVSGDCELRWCMLSRCLFCCQTISTVTTPTAATIYLLNGCLVDYTTTLSGINY